MPGFSCPRAAQVEMRLVDEDDFELSEAEAASLPPDHPMAPYNREVELAILRESIAEAEAGHPGTPLREAFEELRRNTVSGRCPGVSRGPHSRTHPPGVRGPRCAVRARQETLRRRLGTTLA